MFGFLLRAILKKVTIKNMDFESAIYSGQHDPTPEDIDAKNDDTIEYVEENPLTAEERLRQNKEKPQNYHQRTQREKQRTAAKLEKDTRMSREQRVNAALNVFLEREMSEDEIELLERLPGFPRDAIAAQQELNDTLSYSRTNLTLNIGVLREAIATQGESTYYIGARRIADENQYMPFEKYLLEKNTRRSVPPTYAEDTEQQRQLAESLLGATPGGRENEIFLKSKIMNLWLREHEKDTIEELLAHINSDSIARPLGLSPDTDIEHTYLTADEYTTLITQLLKVRDKVKLIALTDNLKLYRKSLDLDNFRDIDSRGQQGESGRDPTRLKHIRGTNQRKGSGINPTTSRIGVPVEVFNPINGHDWESSLSDSRKYDARYTKGIPGDFDNDGKDAARSMPEPDRGNRPANKGVGAVTTIR